MYVPWRTWLDIMLLTGTSHLACLSITPESRWQKPTIISSLNNIHLIHYLSSRQVSRTRRNPAWRGQPYCLEKGTASYGRRPDPDSLSASQGGVLVALFGTTDPRFGLHSCHHVCLEGVGLTNTRCCALASSDEASQAASVPYRSSC